MDSHTTNNENLIGSSSKKPSGSKNNPKPPVIVNENIDRFIEPIIIEVSPGEDVVETLINLARFHQAGIIVLSGVGPVTDVTLLHPVTRSPSFPLQGPFNMLSLSGTYVNPNCGGRVPPRFITNPPCSSFSIFLDGTRRQLFGGVIGGRVISAGAVLVSIALVKNFEFHRMIEINGNIREFEDDDPTYGGLIIPTNVAPQSTNLNAFVPSGSAVVAPTQTQINDQMLSSSLPMDLNVMQTDHSIGTQPKHS